MRVKGPNGLILTFPNDVAEGLLRSPNGEYEEVKDEPKKSESKSTTRKSSSEK
jgi:hypothetical protein